VLSYVVSFLSVAVFPLALAGYGGHLATLAITDPKGRKQALLIVWGLAVIGVVCAGLQQIEAYQSDKEHDQKQSAVQVKLDTSLQRQEYMRGQLDSIGLMLGKVGEKTPDPAVSQLAGAIIKMADNAKASSPTASVLPDLHLRLSYEGIELNGRSLAVSGDNSKSIKLTEFQIHNGADRATGPVSVRLYFSKPVTPSSPLNVTFPWQATPSDEASFPSAFYSAGTGQIIVNPTETWNWPAFSGQLNEDLDEISARLKVFYGSARPLEASFVIHRKK
jgi:hypothetical protein